MELVTLKQRTVKCKGCGHKIKTVRKFGYVFCYRCGEYTRLSKYKRFTYEKAEKLDKDWVFRD